MPNNFLPKCSPAMGVPMTFTIADLSPRGLDAVAKTKALDAVAVTTMSAALNLGARGILLEADFSVPAVTCTVEVYKVDGGDILVKQFTGVCNSYRALYLGNQERVDLQGFPIKVKVVNPTGGNVTIYVRVLS